MIGKVRLTEWSLVDENGDYCIPSRQKTTVPCDCGCGLTITKNVTVKAHINGAIEIKRGPTTNQYSVIQRGIVTAPVMEIRKRTAYTDGRGEYTLGAINTEYRKWLKANHPDWDWKKPFAQKAVTA